VPSKNTLRHHFPFFSTQRNKQWAYLDSAATTQKPQQVIDAMSQYYEQQNTNVHRGSYALAEASTKRFEGVRDTTQIFINAAQREEIIFTAGTTDAINLIAQCYGGLLKPGDEILVSALEHHANLVPWQQVAKQRQCKLRQIPLDRNAQIDIDAYKAMLSDKTALVCVTHMSNATGIIAPVSEMTKLAHRVNAKVCIDGAQAIAHQKVDVQSLDADFYSFSGHKMYGPTGVGVLYAKSKLLDKMPPYRFGGEMIESVTFEQSTFASSPAKFEAGTPNIAAVIGLGAAIDFITCHRKTIEQQESAIYQYLCQQLQHTSTFDIIGAEKDRQAIVSLIGTQHQFDIASLLDQYKVAVRSGKHCTMPLMQYLQIEGTNRISIGCYTNKQDIDQLMQALDNIEKDSLTHTQQVKNKTFTKSTTSKDSTHLLHSKELNFESMQAQLETQHSREQKIKHIMQWSEQINSPNDAIRKQENLIEGCESKVWIIKTSDDKIEIDSASRMMRGICAILLAIYNKNKNAPDQFMSDLNLIGFDKIITSSKRNGINQVIARLIG
jgi:cysteine desulfurase / selenocysteine lyase